VTPPRKGPSALAGAPRTGDRDMMSELRPRPAPTLQRVAFKTSRLAEFVGQRELTAQTGHDPQDWPLVILKELVDNALDACEEAAVAPEISVEVSTKRSEIVVADNGPGLPPETIGGVLDYTVRVSSREAYVSPSRGQQGNALKCIIAMPFALDGTCGSTVIEARGQRHSILFEMDPVRREPRILREIDISSVKTGTKITVRWPETACHLLEAAKGRFLQVIADFAGFNPHLRLRWRWDDIEGVEDVTIADWRKWRTCDPTSAHWYNSDRFARYIAARVARDQDIGYASRTVREFIKELDGLSGSGKQKIVLEAATAARTPLATFFDRGSEAVSGLLRACKAQTRPVKPEALGVVGAEHLLRYCLSNGAAAETFQYRKHLGTIEGVPYAIELAFAYCPDEDYDQGTRPRRLITAGVNFSSVIGSPFERLSPFESLHSVLSRHHVNFDDPVIAVLHYTCPRVDFADRGKGTLTLPGDVGRTIIKMIEAVTKQWEKQRRAELRSEAALERRLELLLKEQRRPEKRESPDPAGILADKIIAEADQIGSSVDDLTVLSRDNDPYTAWRRRREAEWFAGLFNRLVAADGTKHLRGFFYLLVSTTNLTGLDGNRFVNDYKNWQALQKASKAARWLGLVPFDRIIDERNAPPEIFVPTASPILTSIDPGGDCDIPATAEDALPKFCLTGFRGRQTHRIIFYGEKASLSVVLRPIAEAIGAELILVTGESSDTYIAAMAKRASEDGRPAVVFYYSDFDPSGHQMPVSVARKLQALRDLYYPKLSIKLYPVALTLDQIHALGLPSSPLKQTEKRARRWREIYGHDQTEIDAMVELQPDALRQATFDAIRAFYDAGLDNRVLGVELKWRAEADKALRKHRGYQAASKRIRAAWESASVAADNLRKAQCRTAEILTDSVPRPPELPEAKPAGGGKPALFDSDVDFITATRQLIRHKKLAGQANPDAEDEQSETPEDDEAGSDI
jgi:hypothetical protein